MTQLRIENQNSNIEIVNMAIILKLYETALNASGTVYLKGNLQSDHAKQSALTYLNDNTRFPDLHITVPVGAEYVDIQDSAFEQACILYWGDGFGVTTSAIQNITKLEGWYFASRSSTLNNANFDITTINTINLSGFTNLTEIGASVFNGCTNLRNIILPSGLKRLSYDDGGSLFAGCFRDCNNLSNVLLPSTFSWKTSGTVYVEDDYVNTWKAAPGFSDIPDLIQPLSTAPSDLQDLLNPVLS